MATIEASSFEPIHPLVDQMRPLCFDLKCGVVAVWQLALSLSLYLIFSFRNSLQQKISDPTTMDEAGDEWQGHEVSSITFVVIRACIYIGK